MTKLKALIRLARPVLVLGAILVYALGVAMGFAARGRVDWPAALAGFGVTLLVNVMAHYADDYADQDTDALTRRTTFSGGSGVLPSGLVPAVWALRMARGLGLLALVSTVLFIAAGLLPLVTLAIVGLALLGAWFYSMPPISLERHGLGELDNAVVGALLTPLMGYATQTGGIAPVLALSLLPVFAIAMAGLLGAHWSDQEADAAVGRRNLTIQLGRRVTWLHTGMVVIAHVLPLALGGTILPWPVVAGVSLSLPLSAWATWQFSRSKAIASSSYAMMFYIAGATAGWVAAGMLRLG